MPRGKFITFEGPEGGGKTTQARRLVARLEGAGLRALYTREPGGTSVGEHIRDILQHDRAAEPICPEAEVLLFSASRAQLARRVILPALDGGVWVVCDRFADSTTVYQGIARDLGVEAMLSLHRLAIGPAVPDLTFLLDLDVDEGFRRLAERQARENNGPDRMERETREFHRKVREGYLDLARREPDRFRIVDAAASADEIEARVWAEVERGLRG